MVSLTTIMGRFANHTYNRCTSRTGVVRWRRYSVSHETSDLHAFTMSDTETAGKRTTLLREGLRHAPSPDRRLWGQAHLADSPLRWDAAPRRLRDTIHDFEDVAWMLSVAGSSPPNRPIAPSRRRRAGALWESLHQDQEVRQGGDAFWTLGTPQR